MIGSQISNINMKKHFKAVYKDLDKRLTYFHATLTRVRTSYFGQLIQQSLAKQYEIVFDLQNIESARVLLRTWSLLAELSTGAI